MQLKSYSLSANLGYLFTEYGLIEAIVRSSGAGFQAVECQRPYACSPHDLRRSFLTYLLDNGEDLATAADMAGHASADTTRRYLRHQKRRNRAAADKIDF